MRDELCDPTTVAMSDPEDVISINDNKYELDDDDFAKEIVDEKSQHSSDEEVMLSDGERNE